MSFPELLRQCRKQKHMSQAELALSLIHISVRLFIMLQACHGQHAQRQRPVNVLRTEVKGGAEERKVKGHLTDEGKQEQPPDVFLYIPTM